VVSTPEWRCHGAAWRPIYPLALYVCVCVLGLILAFRYVTSDKGREFPSLPLVTRISLILIYWPLLFAFPQSLCPESCRKNLIFVRILYIFKQLSHRTNSNLNDFVNNDSPFGEMSQVA
jgi:hypothetical protein